MVGERWAIGTTILRVTEPRIPCFKLGIRMGDAAFVERFADAARPGTYLGIERAGLIGTGDTITRLDQPAPDVNSVTDTSGATVVTRAAGVTGGTGAASAPDLTVGDVERAYHGHPELLPALVDWPDLSDAWRAWAARRLRRAAERAG